MIAMSYKQIKQLFSLYHSACYSASQAQNQSTDSSLQLLHQPWMRSIKRSRALFHVIFRSETSLSFKNVVVRHSEFAAHHFQNILCCSYLISLSLISLPLISLSLISLYQINTNKCTHILLSHHFI